MVATAKAERILVTGGMGFVGRWIARTLVERERPVITYDRDVAPPADGVTATHGELHDVARLTRVLTDHGIDCVIHTAAISHPDVSVAMPEATFFANAMGTVQVFEAARLAQVRRIVNFSSSSVYGRQAGVVDEGSRLAPTTPYGVSKAAGDMLGGVYRDLFGQEVVSLRIFWVYGPGQRMQEYTHDLVRAAVTGDELRLPAGRDHVLPMVFVRDVAAAAIAAADAAELPLAAYNIAGPDRVTLGELAARITALVPGARIEVGAGDLPVDQLGDMRVDGVEIEAARRDLGFEPRWGLDAGLAEYLEWLRSHEF